MHRSIALFLALALPFPALANDFVPVRDKGEFLSLVQDRELRLSLYGLTLNVLPDGRIEGEALGSPVTGTWTWNDGYFCREMGWNGRDIAYNCQLVEAQDASALRFTVDQGKGQSAVFRLR